MKQPIGTALIPAVLLLAPSFAAPAWAADPEIHYAKGKGSGPIPFELVGNHVYVRARLNGSQPLWFLLDSGATASYLDSRRASALGIQTHEGAAGDVLLQLRGVDVRLAGMRTMPLAFRKYDGHEVDGLLGYDFFRRFVVKIDYGAKSLSLDAPGEAAEGARLPLTLLEDDSGGKVPLVTARITQEGRAPVSGRFILDTGARGTLLLNTPFVASHRMLEAESRTITVTVGGGAMVRDLKLPIGRVQKLQVGDFSLLNPVIAFARDTTGILSATEFDGVIGGELLRRFRIAFDYGNSVGFLEPTRELAAPFEHDMSGLFVTQDDTGSGRLQVHEVLDGSPASEAGIEVGDLILSIDGVPSGRLTLEELRRRLRVDEAMRSIRVQRGETVIEAKLHLRRLI